MADLRGDLNSHRKLTAKQTVYMRSYRLKDTDELWGYMRLWKSQSGLDHDVFVDDCESYKSWNHPLCIMVLNNKYVSKHKYIPISVSANPMVLDGEAIDGISKRSLRKIKSFIKTNRLLLRSLAQGKIGHIDFVDKL